MWALENVAKAIITYLSSLHSFVSLSYVDYVSYVSDVALWSILSLYYLASAKWALAHVAKTNVSK